MNYSAHNRAFIRVQANFCKAQTLDQVKDLGKDGFGHYKILLNLNYHRHDENMLIIWRTPDARKLGLNVSPV